MPIPVHIICGKCGSLDIRIEEDYEVGTHFKCENCAEITSTDTVNEWKEEARQIKKKRVKSNRRN